MNTPRTDAACGWPWGHHGRIESSDLRWSPDGPFVHSSVAREIERENAALRKQLEQWEQSTQWFAEWAEKKQELERAAHELEEENSRLHVELDAHHNGEQLRVLRAENARLRAAIAESEEFARKNGETLAAKVKELLDENAALRKSKEMLEVERCECLRTMDLALNKSAGLRADRDRLDWLIGKGPVERLVTLSSDPVLARKQIDREMEFPTT